MDTSDMKQIEKIIESKLKFIATRSDLKDLPSESAIRSIIKDEVAHLLNKDDLRHVAMQDDLDRLRDIMEARLNGIEAKLDDLRNVIMDDANNPDNDRR